MLYNIIMHKQTHHAKAHCMELQNTSVAMLKAPTDQAASLIRPFQSMHVYPPPAGRVWEEDYQTAS